MDRQGCAGWIRDLLHLHLGAPAYHSGDNSPVERGHSDHSRPGSTSVSPRRIRYRLATFRPEPFGAFVGSLGSSWSGTMAPGLPSSRSSSRVSPSALSNPWRRAVFRRGYAGCHGPAGAGTSITHHVLARASDERCSWATSSEVLPRVPRLFRTRSGRALLRCIGAPAVPA